MRVITTASYGHMGLSALMDYIGIDIQQHIHKYKRFNPDVSKNIRKF